MPEHAETVEHYRRLYESSQRSLTAALHELDEARSETPWLIVAIRRMMAQDILRLEMEFSGMEHEGVVFGDIKVVIERM